MPCSLSSLATRWAPGQAVLEDLLFDLGRDPIGVGIARTAFVFDQRGDAAGLEGLTHFVERVAVIAHDPSGLGDVVQFLG